MATRSSDEQIRQYGRQSSADTAVPATTQLSNGTLTMEPKFDTDRIRTSGQYFDSLVYLKTEESEGKIEGIPDYTSIVDQFALVYGDPVVTPLEDGAASEYVFRLGANRNTWTVESGDSTRAERYTGVFATGYEMSFGSNSGKASFTVNLKGGPMVDGVALTPGTVTARPNPVTASNVLVYVDDSHAALGSTRAARFLECGVKFGDIAELVRFLGGQDTVNKAPDATIELKMEVSGVAEGFLSAMRNRYTKYVRIEATGATIPGTDLREKVTLDFACQGEDHGRGEEDSVYAATVKLRVVRDAFNFSHEVSVVRAE